MKSCWDQKILFIKKWSEHKYYYRSDLYLYLGAQNSFLDPPLIITIEKGEGKLEITCDYLDQKILLEKSDYSTNITVEKGFLSVGGTKYAKSFCIAHFTIEKGYSF